MAIQVYWGCKSPYSARVLLALAIKQIPYESILLRFTQQDLGSRDFLAISPRGQVPAIRDGTFALFESIAIVCYLDEKYPACPLFADEPAAQGLIWRTIMECVYYLEPHMTDFAGTICSGELEKKREKAIRSRESVERELLGLDEQLSHRNFLVGDGISAADVAVYPVVQLLVSTAQNENTEAVSGKLRSIEKHFPNVYAWCRTIESVPGFERRSL